MGEACFGAERAVCFRSAVDWVSGGAVAVGASLAGIVSGDEELAGAAGGAEDGTVSAREGRSAGGVAGAALAK